LSTVSDLVQPIRFAITVVGIVGHSPQQHLDLRLHGIRYGTLCRPLPREFRIVWSDGRGG
jgi:hypothetical protein